MLPWDFIDTGVNRAYLRGRRAVAAGRDNRRLPGGLPWVRRVSLWEAGTW